MKIQIEMVKNGFVVTRFDEDFDDNGSPITTKEVFAVEEEEDCYEDCESKTLQKLFWLIKGMIGPSESKHSKERCMIQIRHGESYECTDSDCEICKDAKYDCKKCMEEEVDAGK